MGEKGGGVSCDVLASQPGSRYTVVLKVFLPEIHQRSLVRLWLLSTYCLGLLTFATSGDCRLVLQPAVRHQAFLHGVHTCDKRSENILVPG